TPDHGPGIDETRVRDLFLEELEIHHRNAEPDLAPELDRERAARKTPLLQDRRNAPIDARLRSEWHLRIDAAIGNPGRKWLLVEPREHSRARPGDQRRLAGAWKHEDRRTRTHPRGDLVAGEILVVRRVSHNQPVDAALIHQRARAGDAVCVFVRWHRRHWREPRFHTGVRHSAKLLVRP